MQIQPPNSVGQATALFTGLTRDQVLDSIKRIQPFRPINTNLHSKNALAASSVTSSSTDFREKDMIEAHRLLQGIVTNPWLSVHDIRQGKTDPFYYDAGLSDIRDLEQNKIGRVTGAPEVNDPRHSFVENLLKLKIYQRGVDNDLRGDYLKNLFLTQLENGSTYYQTQAMRQNESLAKLHVEKSMNSTPISKDVALSHIPGTMKPPHRPRYREIVVRSNPYTNHSIHRDRLDKLHNRFTKLSGGLERKKRGQEALGDDEYDEDYLNISSIVQNKSDFHRVADLSHTSFIEPNLDENYEDFPVPHDRPANEYEKGTMSNMDDCESALFYNAMITDDVTVDTIGNYLDLVPPGDREVILRIAMEKTDRHDTEKIEKINRLMEEHNISADSLDISADSLDRTRRYRTRFQTPDDGNRPAKIVKTGTSLDKFTPLQRMQESIGSTVMNLNEEMKSPEPGTQNVPAIINQGSAIVNITATDVIEELQHPLQQHEFPIVTVKNADRISVEERIRLRTKYATEFKQRFQILSDVRDEEKILKFYHQAIDEIIPYSSIKRRVTEQDEKQIRQRLVEYLERNYHSI